MTVAEKVSQLTNQAAAIPRLDVPAYEWWNEALHGVARAGVATVFPQAIGLAATFDVPLVHEMAVVIADEARAKHHQFVRQGKRGRYQGLTFWSPNINIFRDPRWGRGQETYGEDPYLTGRLGVAFVKGLQGDDPRYYKVDRDRQALRRPQRPGAGPPPLRRPSERARPAGRRTCPPSSDLVVEAQGGLGDGGLQPRQRRVGLGQPAAARATSCAASGASPATWSRTAARSTTSTRATRSWRRRRRRRRSASRRAATSSAAASTRRSARRSSAGC